MFVPNKGSVSILLATSITLINATFADEPQDLVSKVKAKKMASYLMTEDLVVARVADSNTFAAYSKHTGRWLSHKFPNDCEVQPVAGHSTIAFYVSGDAITELVAIDQNGKWCPQKLTASKQTKCTPVIGEDVAAYNVGNVCYAFSGITGQWASIKDAPRVFVHPDTAMLVTEDWIAVFSAHNSVWAKSPNLGTAP